MLRDLLDEDVDLELGDDETIGDEIQARNALILVRQLEREADETKRLGQKIADRYRSKEEALRERVRFLRSALLGYVREHGKAAFPDVGTAYKTKTKPKIVINDLDAVRGKYGQTFTKEVFDETDFKKWALDEFEKTGEIPAGCDVVRESDTLGIRGA